MRKFVFPLLLTFLPFNLYASEFKGFTESCSNFIIEKATIRAVCTAENGAKYNTALRLRGINNYKGVLTAESNSSVMSKFHTSCTQMAIDSNGILAGTCKNANNAYVWTSIDLRTMLRNYNGTLVYP